MRLRALFILLLGTIGMHGFCQEKQSKAKFGKIDPEDFKSTVYSVDSSADAVVLADIGSTIFVSDNKGGFSLEFKRFRRVHILKKNGYDIGNVAIPLYSDGNDAEEQINGLKAVTYNLENGKVVETKLDQKTGLFKDKINSNLVTRKFTFPNIKEGSIIEYEYKITSDFTFNLQSWDFQDKYPTLWSEYNVKMPEFFYYVTLAQGYQPFYIKESTNSRSDFMLTDHTGASGGSRERFEASVTDYRWVMKDVPALKTENFTSTISNHLARLEFQLAEHRHPFPLKRIMGTWPETTASLLKNESFGYYLTRDNAWLNDVVEAAAKGTTNKLDKARSLYEYVRDNITCTDYNRKYLDKKLREVLKSRNGNEAEINLLLTAILLKAGFTADPVILSTRSHGYVYATYPILSRFNYVITRLSLDGKTYFLDASEPRLGFGRLGADCYNGYAKVINEDASTIVFSADSLNERKVSSVVIINDEKGNLSGVMQQSPGYIESSDLRNRIKQTGQAAFFNEIKKGFNAEIEMTDPKIDSLNKYDEPIMIQYDFDIKKEDGDILYVNPMFSEGWKENPFKSAERYYPVEMPYTIDENYLLRMDVPQGYVVDELPKQAKIKLNEAGDGTFEFLVTQADNVISLRSRIRLKRALYIPDEYDMLREFFNFVVKKHAEQIVFKKKK